jgi:hypothetical protein
LVVSELLVQARESEQLFGLYPDRTSGLSAQALRLRFSSDARALAQAPPPRLAAPSAAAGGGAVSAGEIERVRVARLREQRRLEAAQLAGGAGQGQRPEPALARNMVQRTAGFKDMLASLQKEFEETTGASGIGVESAAGAVQLFAGTDSVTRNVETNAQVAADAGGGFMDSVPVEDRVHLCAGCGDGVLSAIVLSASGVGGEALGPAEHRQLAVDLMEKPGMDLFAHQKLGKGTTSEQRQAAANRGLHQLAARAFFFQQLLRAGDHNGAMRVMALGAWWMEAVNNGLDPGAFRAGANKTYRNLKPPPARQSRHAARAQPPLPAHPDTQGQHTDTDADRVAQKEAPLTGVCFVCDGEKALAVIANAGHLSHSHGKGVQPELVLAQNALSRFAKGELVIEDGKWADFTCDPEALEWARGEVLEQLGRQALYRQLLQEARFQNASLQPDQGPFDAFRECHQQMFKRELGAEPMRVIKWLFHWQVEQEGGGSGRTRGREQW